MKSSDKISCKTFPCKDIEKNSYQVPYLEINPDKIKIVMISEIPPLDPKDYFYAPGNPFYMETTKEAFNDAGYPINSINDILNLGVYITTAVKCAKTGSSISTGTIRECSFILEEEMKLFPNTKVYILLGDVAIKSFNYISKRNTNKLAIPNGSTYKLRSQTFYYEDKRVFPSYIITGKNFLIEKSKRKMISEDIKMHLSLSNNFGNQNPKPYILFLDWFGKVVIEPTEDAKKSSKQFFLSPSCSKEVLI